MINILQLSHRFLSVGYSSSLPTTESHTEQISEEEKIAKLELSSKSGSFLVEKIPRKTD